MPVALGAVSLATGVALGLLAAGISVGLRYGSLPGLVVLLVGLGLEGLSVASKELRGEARIAGLALTALVALGLVAWCARASRVTMSAWAGTAALPLSAALAARLDLGPWFHLASPWALVFLATRAGAHRARLAHVALLAGLFVLCALAQSGDSGVLRRTKPPTTAAPSGASCVLVVIDTLRADELAPEGAIARFARGGVRFEQCVSAAPWTLPSVASLLTGLYPSQHGAVTAGSRLAESATTLAELLRARGYATGAFTGGAFVGTAHGLERGFEHFDPTAERVLSTYGEYAPLLWRLAKNRYVPQRWLMDVVDAYRGLSGVLAAACEWARQETDRPKFLLLHSYQVHDYYLYEPDFDDPVLATTPEPSAAFAGRLWVHPSELAQASQADLDHFRALYRGRIGSLERLFPRLVAELTPLVGADAIWIVTSDHGEGFDAKKHRVHHGGRLHEDLLRVPLILSAPGRIEAGRVVEETVRSIDVLPTVLELLGLPVPGGLNGRSLLGPLRGDGAFPSEAVAEDRQPERDLQAMRMSGWKWIAGPKGGELFDLGADPGEEHPLPVASDPGLRGALERFREAHPLPSRVEADLDATLREHLQALGYGD
jgi:arylsulfatase A-like enzyme